MGQELGVWIDHKKAVIVSIEAGHVSTRTLKSGIRAHPRFSATQEGGGEKKYEARHDHDLDGYYDEVIGQLGEPDALLLLGPGEAKLQLKKRLGHSNAPSAPNVVAVETADKMTDPQIVAKVKQHFGIRLA